LDYAHIISPSILFSPKKFSFKIVCSAWAKWVKIQPPFLEHFKFGIKCGGKKIELTIHIDNDLNN